MALGQGVDLASCLAIDLEIGKESGKLHRFAARHGDKTLSFTRGDVAAGLRSVEEMAASASFLVGHNLIAFDLPHLKAWVPESVLHSLPVIDTLRLSPLAFPRNPYHRLIKHYKDGALLRLAPNDPLLDVNLCLDALGLEVEALSELAAENSGLFVALRWLVSSDDADRGLAALFDGLTDDARPDSSQALRAIRDFLAGKACRTAIDQVLHVDATGRWPLAYALAWISVAGGNSSMPPWVRHAFPEAQRLVRKLRDIGCGNPDCDWCCEHHNARKVLQRWFGFETFRPEPACDDGTPMQEAIVAAAMAGKHVLGVLPTGTGKSVCYQVPALSRYENTGALTVVISPLVALMEDQVQNLRKRVSAVAALNGLLSMPERADVLERVRLGEIAILLVSPEQLRNQTFRRAVSQREIGAWVLDEAHCLSKWGHDFRTDYRYVGRYIKETSRDNEIPPILCLTATAKPDVVGEIRGYFSSVLGIDLLVFNGGAKRNNLDFVVVETTQSEKHKHIHELLEDHLAVHATGGAIVYCATRKQTEAIAGYLMQFGWSAAFFHAGLKPESKKATQKQFIDGEYRVIVATNAFGMGIDKPDVRLVIHADIPGSLENYLQEAGRAGRDLLPSRCILLYCEQDMEQQFGLSALSRLPHHEIQAVLRAIRRIAGRRRPQDQPVEVIASPGEILARDEEHEWVRDENTDDTRVRTAVAWLENAKHLARNENCYTVFPSKLRTPTLNAAEERLSRFEMPYQGQLRAIVHALLHADPEDGVTTDELMGLARLSFTGVARAMRDLESVGIVTDDSILTASVHVGVENSSLKRLAKAKAAESALIELMRETAPDLEVGASAPLHLRQVSQALRNLGHVHLLPENVYNLLKGLATDGRSDERASGSIRLKRVDKEVVVVTLDRAWEQLVVTANRRGAAAGILLQHLIESVPADANRGLDIRAETTMGKLLECVENDLVLKMEMKDPHALVQRALLWLHEQEIIRLGRGLIVFRPAMALNVAPGNAPFTKVEYNDLKEHYDEQVVQIHVMAEYARRGLEAAKEAVQLALDYFTLERSEFLRMWFPQAKTPTYQTSDASWKAIVEGVNRVQRGIVTDDRVETNVLVLAGPGSGKTRVLVHRIAYLVRARREDPRGILALTYNRHAALQIRQRLRDLIGDDANRVSIMTCHALAMRLTGTSLTSRTTDLRFTEIVRDAARLLKGEGLHLEEADDYRDRLLAGFRWILVDEYQDIDADHYDLISALAGRTLQDPDRKLSLFAVGDDDQNIYSFRGASVEYIRRFQEDYQARPSYLIANYRSSANIIHAANLAIAPAALRMKAEHSIEIDEGRRKNDAGGRWERFDPLSKGRVQILNVGNTAALQAEQIMREMQRLASLDPEWDWREAAVIARYWKDLEPVENYCRFHGIPVQRADDELFNFWRLRETQVLLEWIGRENSDNVAKLKLQAFLESQEQGKFWDLVHEAVGSYWTECETEIQPAVHFKEWLAEWGRDFRREQQGLLLMTAHRAKGLEFNHVAVLDGGWNDRSNGEDADAPRRLYYVSMTRARQTLLLSRQGTESPLIAGLLVSPAVIERAAAAVEKPTPGLTNRSLRLTPEDIDLGYPGRFTGDHPIHEAIGRLRPGSPLSFAFKDNRLYFMDEAECIVARTSLRFPFPANCRISGAAVNLIQVRFKSDEKPEFAESIKSPRWELIFPEISLQPLWR